MSGKLDNMETVGQVVCMLLNLIVKEQWSRSSYFFF